MNTCRKDWHRLWLWWGQLRIQWQKMLMKHFLSNKARMYKYLIREDQRSGFFAAPHGNSKTKADFWVNRFKINMGPGGGGARISSMRKRRIFKEDVVVASRESADMRRNWLRLRDCVSARAARVYVCKCSWKRKICRENTRHLVNLESWFKARHREFPVGATYGFMSNQGGSESVFGKNALGTAWQGFRINCVDSTPDSSFSLRRTNRASRCYQIQSLTGK